MQAGDGGSPLINMNGEVVGLISAKLSAPQVLNQTGDLTQNVNYAIRMRYVSGLLEDFTPQTTQPASRITKQPSMEDLTSSAKAMLAALFR